MTDINDKICDILDEASALALERAPIDALKQCESPIERLFLFALWSNGVWTNRVDLLPNLSLQDLTTLASQDGFGSIFASPQVEVGSSRADFLLATSRADNEPLAYVAVECDGHDFHEKTKEQAARDKSRDRDFMARGIFVFRFTGAEIWKDAGGCARQVITFLETEWADSRHRRLQRIVEDFGSMESYQEHIRKRGKAE